MTRIRRLEGDRGTTSIAELTIAAGVSAIVAVIVGAYLVSAHVMTVGVTERAIASQEVSEVVHEYGRVLRSSRPLGHCTKDPATGSDLDVWATPLSECLAQGYQVEELGAAVTGRDGDGDSVIDELCGYVYPADQAGVGGELLTPSMMCASINDEQLTFNLYKPSGGATYTTPVFNSTPDETRLVGTVDNPGTVFGFRDHTGTEAAFPDALPDAQTVAVRITPTIHYYDGATERTLAYDMTVALRGGRYLRDGFWTGDQQLDPGAP